MVTSDEIRVGDSGSGLSFPTAENLPALPSPTWEGRFLSLAKHVAGWSKDPSTKVGAVIVRQNKTIASVGYNGFPRGFPDDHALYADRGTKYKYVVHAEVNAILTANEPLLGCTIYTWPLPPCAECMKAIVQAGIKRWVAIAPDPVKHAHWQESFEATRQISYQCRIAYSLYANMREEPDLKNGDET